MASMGGEPCLVAPRLSRNCKTSLRTSEWSASSCLRGRQRSSVDTLEASHLRRAKGYDHAWSAKVSASGQGQR